MESPLGAGRNTARKNFISMQKKERAIIVINDVEIIVERGFYGQEDYISLTDMTKSFEGGSVLIEQWVRNKDTIVFLGTWEKLYNPDFNSPEFEGIKNDAGTSNFYLSTKKWIEKTNAKGILASAGRYGGTFAHKDIAFEFGSWLSPEFKLYLIKEYQRLKNDENERLSLDWKLNRTLAKVNYRIQTDAIKERIIPQIPEARKNFVYASEADVLNVIMFGMTAKEWRDANPDKDGNIRDYADIDRLLVLSNLESFNAELIRRGLSQADRMQELSVIAETQLKSLATRAGLRELEKLNEGIKNKK